MKKGFLVLMAVITMLIGQVGMALGEDSGNLYCEGTLTTNQNEINTMSTNNLGSAWGLDGTVGRTKVTSEWYTKTADGNNYWSNTTKVGFAIIDIEDFLRLDATISRQEFKVNESADPFGPNSVDCIGYLVGLDFRINLAEKFALETDVSYTDRASWKTATTKSDVSILNYKLKCDWMPWESFGFSLGYRYYSYRSDSADIDKDFSGVFFGLKYHTNKIYPDGGAAPVQIWGK